MNATIMSDSHYCMYYKINCKQKQVIGIMTTVKRIVITVTYNYTIYDFLSSKYGINL